MSFLNLMSRLSEMEVGSIVSDYTLAVVSGVLHIEGNFSVVVFNQQSVLIKVKGGFINIEGESLVIKQMSGGEVVVSGKISAVKFE